MDVSEDLGTTLMLENDRVRIWEHRVPAGAAIMISERLISPEAVDEALATGREVKRSPKMNRAAAATTTEVRSSGRSATTNSHAE